MSNELLRVYNNGRSKRRRTGASWTVDRKGLFQRVWNDICMFYTFTPTGLQQLYVSLNINIYPPVRLRPLYPDTFSPWFSIQRM
jgi:hypothetical protein